MEIDHYELFIDSELEYSGIDVMYVAKRLKPWSWYEIKLRACGFSPGSCSPFSIPALVKTLRGSKCILFIISGIASYIDMLYAYVARVFTSRLCEKPKNIYTISLHFALENTKLILFILCCFTEYSYPSHRFLWFEPSGFSKPEILVYSQSFL